jgi:hypothetical protein
MNRQVEKNLNDSTERNILIDWFNAKFPNALTVEEVVYIGTNAGAALPLFTYDAKILYFALELEASPNSTQLTGQSVLYLSDEANALMHKFNLVSVFWDTTGAAAKEVPSTISTKNVYFSRMSCSNINVFTKFIGFKITLP